MGRPRKYNINQDYFETIDSKEKAYWLGFIYADGFITKRTQGQDVFGMTLHEVEPLEKLSKSLESNKPIGKYVTKNKFNEGAIEYRLAVVSDKMVEDLEKQGVYQRKTFSIKFPNLDKDLVSHFVRGYFDGDGSVFHIKDNRVKTGNYYLGMSICGIKSFLESITDTWGILGDREKCIYKDNRSKKDCYTIRLSSNSRCKRFYEYIYRECEDLYLKRKKEKFDNFWKGRKN